jgi:hypothetical protein
MVAVAMIVLLMLANLIIVGLVLGTGRDHEMTVRRVESIEALYAAEAGVNMAVRELAQNVDEDGDGTVGTISDDGNAANDPTRGSAALVVTLSVDGNESTLTAKGRSGIAQRHIRVMVTTTAITGGYDFGNRTPGTDIFGYTGESLVKTPANITAPSATLNAGQYNKLAADDANLHSYSAAAMANYAQMRFVIQVDENEADITRIDLAWSGQNTNDNPGMVDGAELYIWNYGTSSYVQLAVSADTTAQVLLTGAITANIADYLGGLSDNTINLLAVSRSFHVGAPFVNVLYTDYVSVAINGGGAGGTLQISSWQAVKPQ